MTRRHICVTCVPISRGRTGYSPGTDHPIRAITSISDSARDHGLQQQAILAADANERDNELLDPGYDVFVISATAARGRQVEPDYPGRRGGVNTSVQRGVRRVRNLRCDRAGPVGAGE
jgi:hypothetical protein